MRRATVGSSLFRIGGALWKPSLHPDYTSQGIPATFLLQRALATTSPTSPPRRPNKSIPHSNDPSRIVVSILGPPNAGKSTLFNRLLDKAANRAYRLSADRHRPGRRRTHGRIGASTSQYNARRSKKDAIGGGRLNALSAKATASRSGGSGGSGTAIVSNVPGTTRDRRECVGRIGGTLFRLVDTAGVDGERLELLAQSRRNQNGEGILMKFMMGQTLEAARQADLVFLMFDARVGVTADLLETARWLRKISQREQDPAAQTALPDRQIFLLANKLEGDFWNFDGSIVLDHLTEATRLGFGEAIPISAHHGEGLADIAVLIEQAAVAKRQSLGILDDDTDLASNDSDKDKPLQLAILGRQNVGKSTLVNALLKQDRVIVGATPGLTRDAIAVEWTWKNRPVQIVDTAGIRKRSQRNHEDAIEDLSVEDALRAMKVADVAVLVLDAEARKLQRQELAIADAVLKEGRALVVAANKMDLIVERGYSKRDFAEDVRAQLEARYPILRKTPIVPMSSLTGDSVHKLMPVVFRARERWSRKISTGELNRWIAEVMDGKPPPPVSGRKARIKYVMQTKGRPPTFLLFCNVASLPENYLRFLTRNFQDTFEMFGMEVRMAVKLSASKNPYEPTGNRRGGSGLGGREARKKRTIRELKTTGTVDKHRRRRGRS